MTRLWVLHKELRTRDAPSPRRSITPPHLFLLIRSRAEVVKFISFIGLAISLAIPLSLSFYSFDRSFHIVSSSLEVRSSNQQPRKVAVGRNYSDGLVFVYAIKVNRSSCRKIMGHRIWSSGVEERRGLREHPHNYAQTLIPVNLNPNGRMHFVIL